MPSPPDARLRTRDVQRAVGCLRAGGLVALPTETVYGLGADATNPDAVARIFAVKGRPADHPLIVHLADQAGVSAWVRSVPPAAEVLMAACWPGPLTLLLARADGVLDVVTGGRDTVGLRVPAHPMALDLLARFGRGVAAPSANRFGHVSPTSADHVLADLGGRLDPDRDAVLDGGVTPVGVESTIVDCTADPPQLLRPGGIPTEDVERLLGTGLAPAAGPSRAAGMLASHYAPRARLEVVDDEAGAWARAEALRRDGADVDVMHEPDLVRYARELYAWLRSADERSVEVVVAVRPPAQGLGHALRDRLAKAAAPRP